MAISKSAMKMPEFLVFAKMFVVGLVGAEVFRVTFYLGTNFAKNLQEVALWLQVVAVLTRLALCLTYAVKRDAYLASARIAQIYRIPVSGCPAMTSSFDFSSMS